MDLKLFLEKVIHGIIFKVKMQISVNTMVSHIPQLFGLFRISTCTSKSLEQFFRTFKCVEARIGDHIKKHCTRDKI